MENKPKIPLWNTGNILKEYSNPINKNEPIYNTILVILYCLATSSNIAQKAGIKRTR